MSAINVQYEGKLRCKAVRVESGKAVETDVAADHGGLGEFCSPVELAVSALGACAMSMAAFIAQRDGVDLTGATTSVEFQMADAPARRIGSVRLTFHLPGSVPESVRPKLAAAVKACPVKNSLHPDIAIEIAMQYE
jgi:putative redox protein